MLLATMQKSCQNCDSTFQIELEDLAFYERIQVAAPTWCSECRLRRRLLFRNERFLYKRKSDFSGKEIFTMYPQESEVKVYENEIWFGDEWDAMEYGLEYDPTKSFLIQLLELSRKVPRFALSTLYGVNSDYANNYTGFKNCYLAFHGNYAEDCLYGTGLNYSKNCVDNTEADHSENCYGNFCIERCANTFCSVQCSESFNLYLCKSCVGCNDCIACVNLRGKKHHIFNKPETKEAYEKKMREFNLGSHNALESLKTKAHAFWKQFPVRYMYGTKNLNCTGDYISNSKNVNRSFIVKDGENIRYSSHIQHGPTKDCYDYSVWGDKAELVYESAVVGLGVSNMRFCFECWNEVMDAEYSLYSSSSSHIFGCVGIKKKQHCILNKQYSENEYHTLREKIIKDMDERPFIDKSGHVYRYGEFLPPLFSPFPYNHTNAQDYFPLSKGECLAQGYVYKENEHRDYSKVVKSTELPDTIAETPSVITEAVVACKSIEEDRRAAEKRNCAEAFRILPRELQFYKTHNIPLPQRCYHCRHFERIQNRNPIKFYKRQCACKGGSNSTDHAHNNHPCPNEFLTSYTPERKDIIYCEACYQQEVI